MEKEKDYYIPDNVAEFTHRPYAERVYRWPEHPQGRIILRTNNLGLREDEDTVLRKACGGTRMLVTGDSHIDGVVYNAESFPHILEDLLNEQAGGKVCEALNAGVGYYTLYNYLGCVERYRALLSDLVIVVIYTGNDFSQVAYRLEQEKGPMPRPQGYFLMLRRFMENDTMRPLGAQVLHQAYYFKNFPEMEEPVIEETARIVHQIDHACRDQGARLLVLFLPTAFDVHPDRDGHRRQRCLEMAGLSPDELSVASRITDRVSALLSAAGIPCYDLRDDMQGVAPDLFWRKDYHLSTLGHRFVAHAVLKKYGAAWLLRRSR